MSGEGVTQGVRLADRHISAARFTRGESAAAVSLGGLIPGKGRSTNSVMAPKPASYRLAFPNRLRRIECPMQVLTWVLPTLDGQQILRALNVFALILQQLLLTGEAIEPATLLAASQACRGTAAAFSATEQGIEGIEQDRFAGARLAGEHGEAGPEAQLQPLTTPAHATAALGRSAPRSRGRPSGNRPQAVGASSFLVEGASRCHGGCS